MAGARKKVSQGSTEPPFGKNAEAEDTRRQMKNMPFPIGGQTLSGTAPGPGTTVLDHNLGHDPSHWVLYDHTEPAGLGVTAHDAKTISVQNAALVPVTFSIYIW